MTRTASHIAFAAILASCIAGAFSLSWWLASAAAAILVLVSLVHHRPVYDRYAGAGNSGGQTMLLLGTALNAATAVALAFVAGRMLAWLWGV